jgi:hypothetical protein
MLLEKLIFFSIEYFYLDDIQTETNNLQMAAGGNHYLMFM